MKIRKIFITSDSWGTETEINFNQLKKGHVFRMEEPDGQDVFVSEGEYSFVADSDAYKELNGLDTVDMHTSLFQPNRKGKK